MTEFKTLAENESMILECRAEYFDKEDPKAPIGTVWAGIKLRDGNGMAIRLGYFPKDPEKSLKMLNEFTAGFTLEDRTELGWYCLYCQRYSGSPMMADGPLPKVLKIGDQWVKVKSHYDGCRGWD